MLKGLKLTKRPVEEGAQKAPATQEQAAQPAQAAPKFKSKYDFADFKHPSEDARTESFDPQTREELTKKADDIWDLLKNGKIAEAQTQVNALENWTQRVLIGQSGLHMGTQQNGSTPISAPTFGSKSDAIEHSLGLSHTRDQESKTSQRSDNKASYLDRIKHKAEKRESLVLANCRLCLANGKLREEEVLTVGDHFYLLQPNQTPFPGKHFLLVPLAHCRSIREIAENEREELEQFITALSNWARSQGSEILCLETAYMLDNIPHAKLEVVVAPVGTFDEAALFFTQCFEGVDGDWNTHRKVIALAREKGGLFRQIPPGFPYVAVLWGAHDGLLHIIEEENKFDRKVVYQVVATMMESDSLLSKAAKEITADQMLKLKAVFTSQFKLFEPVS